MSEKAVFFTLASDEYYYPAGCHKFVNSFKRFHPDIDLVVFRQDMIDKVFKEKGINFFNAKPTFAKLLTPYFDLVVNIDCDSLILGRAEEVLKQDYDIGAAWNYNDYENRKIENVSEKMFLNAGLVASRDKTFWDIWERENRNAYKYTCAENDILCLNWYNHPYIKGLKRKVFDKDIKDFYGCKSLGKEKYFALNDGKVMYNGGRLVIYHNAKGKAFPKLDFYKLGFQKGVADFMEGISVYGATYRMGAL